MFDKEHYLELIEQLKPIVNEPEFADIFAQLTADEDGPTKLQLKMELRRLVTPCNRSIDMRSEVIHDCVPVPHNGRIHYLDQRALVIFENGLSLYQGVFTQDTYEQIQRLLSQSDADSAVPGAANIAASHSHIHVPAFKLAGYAQRNEERMNFVSEVKVIPLEGSEFEASTTDLSVQGMRIKVPSKLAVNLTPGAEVSLRFTGLAQKFTIDQRLRIPYIVIDSTRESDQVTYLKLRRKADFESESFDTFLLGFINGHKKRYKINLDNTLAALVAKGHEQFFMPRLNALPLFFKRVEQRMFTDMVLQTDNNKHIINSWLDENNQTVIGGLFTGRRLTAALKQPQEEKQLVIYSFSVTARGKVYFYSASAAELEQTGLRDAFISFGRSKDSWRVYQLSLTKADKSKLWLPLSVPDTAVTNVMRPPSPRVMKRLEGISHVGQLLDVTSEATPELEAKSVKRQEAQRLKQFAHTQKLSYKTQIVTLEFVNLRKESRFNYRTPAKFNWQGRNYYGVTVDFSVSGLQLEIEDTTSVGLDAELKLDLTELNRHRKHANLLNLNYQVVGRNEDGSILNLRAVGAQTEHPGARFFHSLIEKNREELRISREKNQLHGIELCLRNLCCASQMSLPMFVHRPRGQLTQIGQVGYSAHSGLIAKLLAQQATKAHHFDLSLLFNNQQWNDVLVAKLEHLQRDDSPAQAYLALDFIKQNKRIEISHQWLQASELSFAIEETPSTATAVRQILRFNLSRTGRPDMEFIQRELNYVANYASHKASDLEAMLWSVSGVIDVQDITPAVAAMDTSVEDYTAKQEQLAQWLAEPLNELVF